MVTIKFYYNQLKLKKLIVFYFLMIFLFSCGEKSETLHEPVPYTDPRILRMITFNENGIYLVKYHSEDNYCPLDGNDPEYFNLNNPIEELYLTSKSYFPKLECVPSIGSITKVPLDPINYSSNEIMKDVFGRRLLTYWELTEENKLIYKDSLKKLFGQEDIKAQAIEMSDKSDYAGILFSPDNADLGNLKVRHTTAREQVIDIKNKKVHLLKGTILDFYSNGNRMQPNSLNVVNLPNKFRKIHILRDGRGNLVPFVEMKVR